MLWRFCFCLSLQKLSQTEQNVSSLDRTDRPVLYCPCRRWPETRRTITRTHPNRSRGKLTSTSAATRTTSTASWTRWPLRSRWSSREIVEPLLDFVLFSVSGWDGPDSGETVSVRTAESESESQRREALRLVTDLSDAAGHFSCSSPSCQHFLFVFCVRDIVLILLPTVFCVLNGKHVFFKYKYDWNSLKLVWRMFFFLQDENILAETHCRVWSSHSLSGRVSDLNLNQNTLMMMMMMMIYMRGVWLQFHVFKLHWSLNM